MKRLNVKLLLILIACTAVFFLCVFLVHAWQVNRNADTLRARADAARKAGDPAAAAKHRQRYMQFRRDDHAQHAELARDLRLVTESPDWNRDPKDVAIAFAVYERALRKAPANNELRRELVDFYMKWQRNADAIGHLELLLENYGKEDNEKLDLEVLLATCLARTGQNRKAADLLAKMVGYNEAERKFDVEKPRGAAEVDAYLLLADVYRRNLLQDEHAQLVMEELIQRNGDSWKARLAWGQHLLRQAGMDKEKQEQGRQEIFKALKLAPEEADAILAAAGMLMSSGKDDKKEDYARAKELLEKGLKKHPDDARLYQSLAQLAVVEHDRPEALRIIEQGLKELSESPTLLWMLANVQVEDGEFKKARKTIERLEKAHYHRPMIRYLDGRIAYKEGRWAQAAKILAKVRPDLDRSPQMAVQIDRLLAGCYERLNMHDSARDAYERVVSEQPGDLNAWESLARIHEVLGHPEEARRIRRRISETLKQLGRETPLVLRIQAIQELIGHEAGRAEQDRNWTKVDAALAEILARDDVSQTQKVLLRNTVLLAKGQGQQAYDLVFAAAKQNPDELSLWMAAVDAIAREKGAAAALAATGGMKRQFGDSVSLRLKKAELLLRQGGAEVKTSLAELEKDVGQFDDDDRATLWRSLGGSYYRLRDFDQARRLWQQVAEARPNDLPIRTALFELAQQTGDDAAMGEALGEIEKVAGEDSATAKLYEATQLIWQLREEGLQQRLQDRARRLLEEAREKRPAWHLVALRRAQLASLENDQQRALVGLQEAMNLGPVPLTMARQLIQWLLSRNQVEQARQALSRVDPSQVGDMKDLRSRVLAAEGKLEKAVQLAREVAEGSERAQDHLWLGRLLARSGETAEAEQVLRHAVDLDTKSVNVHMALVQLLLAEDRSDEAQKEIHRIEVSLPENQVPLVMGQCYELMRDFPEARRYYLMALAADPGNRSTIRRLAGLYALFGYVDETKKYIEMLLDGAKPNAASPPPEVAWARRAKAQILAETKDYGDYQEAMRILRRNVPKGGRMSPTDFRVMLQIMSERPDPVARADAIKLLEQASGRRDLTADEKLILARLYDKAGRWVECEGIMLELLGTNKKPSDSLVIEFIKMLLRNGEGDKVRPWLTNLDPQSPEVQSLRLHMLAAQGKDADVIKVLNRLVPAKLAQPEALKRLRGIAGQYEELARYKKSRALLDEAEKLLRQYVKRRSGEELQLAAFLGRRGKVDETIDICGDFTKPGRVNLDALELAVMTLAEHRSAIPHDSPLFARVKKWFDAARVEYPEQGKLLLQSALLEELQGNMDNVRQLYEEYLNRPRIAPHRRAIAQNNLAYLLAIQGEGDKSHKLIEGAIGLLGPTADLLDTRAVVYLARGNVDKALQDINEAIRGGENANKLFHRALIYMTDHRKALARDSLDRAKDLDFDPSTLSTPERKKYRQLLKFLGVSEKETEVSSS